MVAASLRHTFLDAFAAAGAALQAFHLAAASAEEVAVYTDIYTQARSGTGKYTYTNEDVSEFNLGHRVEPVSRFWRSTSNHNSSQAAREVRDELRREKMNLDMRMPTRREGK